MDIIILGFWRDFYETTIPPHLFYRLIFLPPNWGADMEPAGGRRTPPLAPSEPIEPIWGRGKEPIRGGRLFHTRRRWCRLGKMEKNGDIEFDVKYKIRKLLISKPKTIGIESKIKAYGMEKREWPAPDISNFI
jgi:hypothetical protein